MLTECTTSRDTDGGAQLSAPDLVVVSSTVLKLCIRPGPRQCPVNVFLEEYGAGKGKVTIDSDCDAWSYFWGNIADDSIRSFFMGAHPDYLVRKLKTGIEKRVLDDSADALIKHTRSVIIDCRLRGDLTRDRARYLFNLSAGITDGGVARQEGLMEELLGPEWYWDLPEKPNPDYWHLRSIVEVVQQALRCV